MLNFRPYRSWPAKNQGWLERLASEVVLDISLSDISNKENFLYEIEDALQISISHFSMLEDLEEFPIDFEKIRNGVFIFRHSFQSANPELAAYIVSSFAALIYCPAARDVHLSMYLVE